MKVLVTGGAGYIGAHIVRELLDGKPDVTVVVVDSFREGKNNIISDERVQYEDVDIRNHSGLRNVFERHVPTAVVHCAALASVPDSMNRPAEYYETNIIGGYNLLECMREYGVRYMVFSSSASVYGEPQTERIAEDHPKNPTNPYGYTKLVFERMLDDYRRAHNISSVSFRYFCAAGCRDDVGLGEYHSPETHVIPQIVLTALGKQKEFSIFGDDFPTPDGTGVRDFVHVSDIASAHILAIDFLVKTFDSVAMTFNLGTKDGYSVRELIRVAEEVASTTINAVVKSRRPGDPSALIAESNCAREVLGWEPQYTDIRDIVGSVYRSFAKR